MAAGAEAGAEPCSVVPRREVEAHQAAHLEEAVVAPKEQTQSRRAYSEVFSGRSLGASGSWTSPSLGVAAVVWWDRTLEAAAGVLPYFKKQD
jgi:hypothetical protein